MLNRNSALKTQYSIVKMAIADNEGGSGGGAIVFAEKRCTILSMLKKGVQF